ncbi:Glucoamylase [Golovinomyces cichoracearum]|uniref:Glucoamylase n=1 Tax=Golovinomyces cichoracearum TaxID=62708 RepID=A0A420J2S0_9PEZI|nr:Glucoamylase [Golovinomyces cichoracearum]
MQAVMGFVCFIYSTFALLTLLSFSVHSISQNPIHDSIIQAEEPKLDLDDFSSREAQFALSRILCNIGPEGACVSGTSLGLVVAGPGKTNPNCKSSGISWYTTNQKSDFYTWTRDSALTVKCLVDKLVNEHDHSLLIQVENYITAQARIQTVINPSGDLSTGAGLGEPKFNVDASPFAGPWGRPQRDGPALRATTLITYSKWLINTNHKSTVTEFIWPIIQNDLHYIAQYWNKTGFDLWEEVEGSSFYTISAQYRALLEGSLLASLIGKTCPLCDSQAPQVICFLQNFWNSSGGYILANVNEKSKRSAKDTSTILASIHQFDPSAQCDSRTFQPCSDLALSNHKVVTDSFRSIYPINAGIKNGRAVSVGRYPEDQYYNGNPWYITSLAAAEQLYDALYIWKKFLVINITDVSLPFFRDFSPQIKTGSYYHMMPEYQEIYDAIFKYADEYMKIVQAYTQSNGSLSEQFDKATGEPLSAYDLTWSYTAFLTATDRRSGIVPYSWGEDPAGESKVKIPSVCAANPETGDYTSAPKPTWPVHQTPPDYTPIPCSPVTTVSVTFNVLATTSYGDTIKILGSDSSLGNWDLENAISMSASEYSSNYPIWRVTVLVNPGTSLMYKYVNFKSDGTVYWESGNDRTLDIPKSCESGFSTTEIWRQDES